MVTSSASSDDGAASTAAPPLVARIIAVVAIVLAGLCGGLIGFAVMDLQCTNGCTTYAGLVGIGAAILAALKIHHGVADESAAQAGEHDGDHSDDAGEQRRRRSGRSIGVGGSG